MDSDMSGYPSKDIMTYKAGRKTKTFEYHAIPEANTGMAACVFKREIVPTYLSHLMPLLAVRAALFEESHQFSSYLQPPPDNFYSCYVTRTHILTSNSFLSLFFVSSSHLSIPNRHQAL